MRRGRRKRTSRAEQSKARDRKAREIVTITVDDEHQFWPFTGEYWRDELGYYRYRLVNKCGTRFIPEGAPDATGAGEAAVEEAAGAEGATPPAEGAVPSGGTETSTPAAGAPTTP